MLILALAVAVALTGPRPAPISPRLESRNAAEHGSPAARIGDPVRVIEACPGPFEHRVRASVDLVGNDPRWQILSAPLGMSLVGGPATGALLRWYVPPGVSGARSVELLATDRRAPSRRERMSLELRCADIIVPASVQAAAGEPPPVVRLGVRAGDRLELSLRLDEGRDESAFRAISDALPGSSASRVDPRWIRILWIPGPERAGTVGEFVVRRDRGSATDALEGVGTTRFVVTVRPSGYGASGADRVAPEPAYHIVNAGRPVVFRIAATPVDSGKAKLHAQGLPAGAFFDARDDGSGRFYWPTDQADVGEHRLRFAVPDGRGVTEEQEVIVLVTGGASSGAAIGARARPSAAMPAASVGTLPVMQVVDPHERTEIPSALPELPGLAVAGDASSIYPPEAVLPDVGAPFESLPASSSSRRIGPGIGPGPGP